MGWRCWFTSLREVEVGDEERECRACHSVCCCGTTTFVRSPSSLPGQQSLGTSQWVEGEGDVVEEEAGGCREVGAEVVQVHGVESWG